MWAEAFRSHSHLLNQPRVVIVGIIAVVTAHGRVGVRGVSTRKEPHSTNLF